MGESQWWRQHKYSCSGTRRTSAAHSKMVSYWFMLRLRPLWSLPSAPISSLLPFTFLKNSFHTAHWLLHHGYSSSLHCGATTIVSVFTFLHYYYYSILSTVYFLQCICYFYFGEDRVSNRCGSQKCQGLDWLSLSLFFLSLLHTRVNNREKIWLISSVTTQGGGNKYIRVKFSCWWWMK